MGRPQLDMDTQAAMANSGVERRSAPRSQSVITLNQQIEEVERELAMRRQVYPNLKGSKAQKDYQMLRMEAVHKTLRWLRENEALIKGMLSKIAEEEAEAREAGE
jgi:hypothetical protein